MLWLRNPGGVFSALDLDGDVIVNILIGIRILHISIFAAD
jgi:hypothetical protein